MARIRSTHPTQWTDEDFVELSYPARLLAIAIRNFADDQGVFEWKPKSLKMKIFPADDIGLDDLLSELIEFDHIKKIEVGEKSYGLVRNFRKYQRPKKPTEQYKLPNEFRIYVGLSDQSSETQSDENGGVTHQLPTGGEMSIQMEDGGGNSRVEGVGDIISSSLNAGEKDVNEDNVNRMLDALGVTDESKSHGLLVWTEIFRWFENGCDLEKDILPVLKAKAAQGHKATNWAYFTKAIFQAKANRTAPPPTVEAKPTFQPFEDAVDRRRRKLKEKQQQEAGNVH